MNIRSKKTLLLFALISILNLSTYAQIKLTISRCPNSYKLTDDSILVTVRFKNTTNKDYLLFNTKHPLPYCNPIDFYMDPLTPPTSLVVFTDDQNIIAKPKIKFEYFQVEFLDTVARNEFIKTQAKLSRLQDSLIKSRIQEAQKNPFLIPSKSYIDIEYSIILKEIQIHPVTYKLKICYSCKNFFRFEKTSRDIIRSQFENAEIFIGSICSKQKKLRSIN